jgi:hypothetical protein
MHSMTITWNLVVWQQFGAAITMLENALQACPDELWRDKVWDDPIEAPEYTQFWFIVYHTLVWTDRYLSGSPDGFKPPAPFVAGALPETPYRREALQAYLEHIRQKCRATLEMMTDEQANEVCKFPWGPTMRFAELQLYTMRHVQEHAAQLSLHLGNKGVPAPDWVMRAEGQPG